MKKILAVLALTFAVSSAFAGNGGSVYGGIAGGVAGSSSNAASGATTVVNGNGSAYQSTQNVTQGEAYVGVNISKAGTDITTGASTSTVSSTFGQKTGSGFSYGGGAANSSASAVAGGGFGGFGLYSHH